MESGFLSQKGSGMGRGVKEKDLNDVSNKVVKDGVVPSITVASGSTQKQNVGQSSTGLTTSKSGPDVSFASLLKGESKPKGTPLMFDSYTFDMCTQSWGRSSYARALIEIRVDVELKDTIVVAMPKLTREGYIQEECPKNPGLGMAKNLKKPSQASRGVPVRMKVGSKPAKEYRPIAKKPTDNTSDIKKKGVEPIKEGATSSGSSLWNVETSSISSTPIVEKIRKLEQLIIDRKGTLVDDDCKPLKRVDYLGDHDNDDEVCSVDNDMARSMAANGRDLPDKFQDICDSLDIRV
ncbi:hypothetical protein Tco_0138004 [Tanacetum coccineum]